MNLRNIFLFLSIFALVSCASRESGWEKKSEESILSSAEAKLMKDEAMAHWKKRVDPTELEQALSKFEMVHATNPNDLKTLIYLTRGYYFFADAHIDDPELKKNTFEKAASFGEKAMATNEEFKKKMVEGKSVEESLDSLTKKEVPAIYWTAASLGKWAKATGIAAALKYKTRLKAMIARVEKLNPTYFYGAPQRYWGGFYAVAPSFAGGDMNKSKANFDKSIKLAPEYLGTRVLLAELYWVKIGNKEEFKKELQTVLDSKEDAHPKLGPENTMEKKKAQRLLSQIDELF